MIYIGLDLGTHGIKYHVLENLDLIERGNVPIYSDLSSNYEFYEQNPEIWRETFLKLYTQFKKTYGRFVISISSTSGSVLPVDKNGIPVYNAIMYNDSRSSKEASFLNGIGEEKLNNLGYKFNSSFSLPKILWVKNNLPDVYRKTKYFLHPADFLVFLVSGQLGITDHSNALKSGFDIIEYSWPDYIEKAGIEIEKLPKVFAPTTRVYDSLALGMTDGCSSQIATGTFEIGKSLITVGSTLVIKAVSEKIVPDKLGRFYYHLNFDSKTFLPGGASNAGGVFFEKIFDELEIEAFSEKLNSDEPSKKFVYPTIHKVERFPFSCNNFKGMSDIENFDSKEELFKSAIEGLAYISKYSFDLLYDFSVKFSDSVFVSGPMFNHKPIMKLFANILNRKIVRTKFNDASYGDALLAMMKDIDLDNVRRAIKIDCLVEPNRNASFFQENYINFKKELESKLGECK
jgi:sugar (pentulose or hexulose) kinase